MLEEKHSFLTLHFLAHQRIWVASLLSIWMLINVLILATNVLLEDGRDGLQMQLWEPFCWEITSALITIALIPFVVISIDKFISPRRLKTQLFIHLLCTLPFSLVHVAGMVGLRKVWYWLMDSQYYFGDLSYELFYEYRKDAQTYFIIVLLIYGYRFIVRRLQGEASIIGEVEAVIEVKRAIEDKEAIEDKRAIENKSTVEAGAINEAQIAEKKKRPEKTSEANSTSPERFLIKKLGKEFLIKTRDIEWIEAAGNYANLHIGNNLYPMRTTMSRLEKILPSQDFARIHRSSIVNLSQIETLQALETGDYELALKNGEKLSLSRRYRDRFKELLEK